MVRKSRAVERPVVFGRSLQVRLVLSAEGWDRPDTNVVAVPGVLLARPERDERTVGREAQAADRWIDKCGHLAASQVVKLSRTDLRNPDVRLSIPVREKGHEMTVA